MGDYRVPSRAQGFFGRCAKSEPYNEMENEKIILIGHLNKKVSAIPKTNTSLSTSKQNLSSYLELRKYVLYIYFQIMIYLKVMFFTSSTLLYDAN